VTATARVARFFQVLPGEGRTVLLLSAMMFLVSAGGGLGGNAVDALLFARFGVASLPPLYIALGFCIVASALAFSAALARGARGRFYILLLLGLAVAPPAAAQKQAAADPWLARPVDNRTFQTFLDFFAYDRQLAFDLRVLDAEEQAGVRKQHLSFQSTPGVRVFANLYRPTGAPAQKRPAIVLLHGGGPKGKDLPGTTLMAELLARAGWDVLAIDMPYFGERSTDLFTTFSEQEKHEKLYNQPPAYLAWVTQIVKDVSRAIDLLVEHRSADAKRIALVGISRGAIVAAVVGGAERRLAAVVMLYGGHWDALERGHLPAACPANYIGRISPRPLLMINGTQDTDMLRETAVDPLYRRAKPPKQILWANTGHQLPTEEHRAVMLRWLRENLK
jgi:acetyl esterase/lipase